MKKVLLALFLIFGFVSTGSSIAEFSITDERGVTQSSILLDLELDIPAGSTQQYSVNITDLSFGNTFRFQNISAGNMLLRFNAGVTSKRQVIFKVSDDDKNYSNDYYALSSCEVDKNPQNRPTRSFFIINSRDIKFLKFFLRNCETGEIINDKTETLDLKTTLLAIQTQMSDNSVDPQNGSVATYGLPAVIIGEDTTTRDLRTKSATGNQEFLCRTANEIKSLELYDGSGKQITPFSYRTLDGTGEKINFTIENRPGINYRKMHLKLTCNNNKEQLYYFDARPKEIRVSNLPNNEWLYAEQKYRIDGTAYDDGFSDAIKQIGSLANCDNCKLVANSLESKTMNAITLTPVDAKGNIIESYNSIAEIAITGKIYSDDSDQNPINETNGNALIRPCVAGSKANCEIAIAEINGNTSSAIYTDIVNKTKVLAYNNVGPTVLYGVDTEWTKYSQTYIESNQISPLCDVLESHDYEKNVGKQHKLVGCNIPFVNANGGELNFYTFKPALYKLLFESKNSPQNDSYGTDKLTYIHTIKADDYDAANNKIFEAADFNASILAIGASLESLKNNRTLSHYDNNLKVANTLKFSGNPANPTIAIEGTSTKNDIAADFRVTVNNDETDISGALMLTLEPNNPYNHESGYKANPTLTEITDKNNITIDRPKDNFYAGKNIKVNKLNLKREDLLARSYAHIGSSSVNIDMTKNADLNTKITTDQAAFISSYKGDDLNFVDAAIIAPNVASNGTTTDGAVYLAGYCESTSLTACKESKVFISSAIAGHINYYGFDFLAYGNNPESTTDSLFEYSDATFSQFKRGADFLKSFEADKVTIMLKGDQAKEYCNIFRNCYALGNGKFGTTFNSYKASIRQWHGSGDQGKTIVDSINEAGKTTTRRKEQRLSF
ncbi:hypothetical protein PTQ35_06695 [Campylobacter sp. 46490-21]|uniref:hypothetical protein n=1 Tax=Campylobacter magnus TaxID=3026462 RepID=UPI0023602299|nr:hypothetical protein [Campylobacter magnus]MDD0848486.1 hypothetical protein [Campylobacter magnus]